MESGHFRGYSGWVFIALGTYNFAAAAEFPMVGVNGIALIFYHLWGLPIGRTAMLLNIPCPALLQGAWTAVFSQVCADHSYYLIPHGLCCPSVSSL